jgi:hypothetical protein
MCFLGFTSAKKGEYLIIVGKELRVGRSKRFFRRLFR